MERIIGHRKMRGDDGLTYTVVDIQEYTEASDLNGRAAVPGFRRSELEDGTEVIMLDGHLTIQSNGVRLFTDD